MMTFEQLKRLDHALALAGMKWVLSTKRYPGWLGGRYLDSDGGEWYSSVSWHPTANWACAMLLFEKINGELGDIHLSSTIHPRLTWRASITPFHNGEGESAEAETGPLAISLVVAKALGVEV